MNALLPTKPTKLLKLGGALAALALISPVALADEFSAVDTTWVMVCTALVMLMTPAGLALFYGGLTQRKSVLNTIGMAFTAYCVATVAWIVAGYSIAFGDADSPFWGGLGKAFLIGVDINDLAGTIPEVIFVAFQGTFAAITVAIVSGAIIERTRFSTWLVFSFFWVILCYAPICHFVWGGGFLSTSGELDFAGGTVVHINSGIAGLTLAFLIGKRKQLIDEKKLTFSIKFTMLGAALLWFGWFGFNAGSALGANTVAANAILITNVAAAVGGLTWLLTEWACGRPRTLVGTSFGVVAGLVGITPASGFVDVSGAIAIGLISALVGYFAVMYIKEKLGYDDSLDAFGLHGVVGIVGSLATGIFANPAITEGAAGLLYGNPGQVWVQFVAVIAVCFYSVVATSVIFLLSRLITGGSRISSELEERGMDIAYHHEADHLTVPHKE